MEWNKRRMAIFRARTTALDRKNQFDSCPFTLLTKRVTIIDISYTKTCSMKMKVFLFRDVWRGWLDDVGSLKANKTKLNVNGPMSIEAARAFHFNFL